MLQTALERARGRREPLYCCFVDLAKAYDSVPRGHLFKVLTGELGISPSTVKCLSRMYEQVQASVVIGRDYSDSFELREGVRQGCPASPLVFSLYMDRLESYLASAVLRHLSGGERDSIRLAGCLVPLLLFADDIVVMATQREVVQRVLDALGAFCAENGLTVSVAKTKWLVGGWLSDDLEVGALYY